MSSWRSLVLRIGEKCSEYGGNADYKDQLETCFGVVRRELLHSGEDILTFLLQCAEQLPHKIPLYGTLVGLLNLEDEDFVRKILENTHENLQVALDSGNCNRMRILLRFLTVLMCSKVLQPSALVVLFETLLSSAATTVDEDKGNPSWQACADFYITCILSCLPWGGAELVEQIPEEMDRVMMGIQAYMSIRRHVSDAGCSPFEYIDDKNQGEGGNDFLEDLWSRIQDLSGKGWKLDSVPRPHLSFEPQLVAGKSHDFGPLNCPELPAPPTLVTGIAYGKQKHEAELKYPQRIRRLNIFPATKTEPKGTSMVGLPVTFRYEYLMAETIFSQILLLPQPPFKPIYYTLVIMDLCKALPGAFPAVVAGAVRSLFDKIADLDMECRTRLILWFSHHLSNFQFIWPWEEWAYVLDLPKWAPQRVFVQEVLEREVRLSYWDKIKQSIESAPALEELLPPKGTANFTYSAEDGDQTEHGLSAELNRMVKERVTSREIISWIEDHLLPAHGLDVTLRVVIQTLLNIGSKSFTHLITVLERYGQVIARICPDQDQQVMLISEVSSFWKNNAQMTAITIDRMMGYRLISNVAIVRWVFSSSIVNQFHVSDRPWEILRNALTKTFNRITDLRKEILSLKKSVLLATEAASKAEADLEDAKSKLTLTLVDGEPVLAENPVKMKRLKSNAEKTKEEELSTKESLEAKEALLVRASDEIEALFLFLYKSFSSVLAEPLRDTDGSLHLPTEAAADEMAIDNEETPTTDLDNEDGGSQKSHANGGRSKNAYNVGEKEQWCLTTLGYVKAFTRQYASESSFIVVWEGYPYSMKWASIVFVMEFPIWPLVEKLDAEHAKAQQTEDLYCQSVMAGGPNYEILGLTKLSRQKRFVISASSASSSSGPEGFSWLRLSQSIRRGSQRFFENLGESLKKETGFNLEDAMARVDEISGRASDSVRKAQDAVERVNSELLPQFVSWNKWERWKDIKNWEPKRLGVLLLYLFVTIFSCQSIYKAVRAPIIERERRELAEAYMDALIPEPTPTNVRKFKQGLWRKSTPKGLKLKKFVEGPDGSLVHDSSFVGEYAWEDDAEKAQDSINEIIEHDTKLNNEDEKVLQQDLGLSVENQSTGGTWRDRLAAWKEILQKEKLAEQLDSLNSKYVVEFDMKEVENSLRKDVVEKAKNTQGTRALWISKRWWRYRPKLPYTYFLQKLDSFEVAAVVFTEDLKTLYVTMKEGFPLEYVVDIPLDPFLFEAISGSGVEVDLLQKRQIHYFLKVVFALLPGLLILWFIRESLMILHITTNRFLYKKYNQLFDMAYADNLILPVGEVGETKSMYKDVVLGGDVWDLLDELMIYMGNPMQYYERDVKFVRGVLLSGPPGTGKTLFARTLAKESGLPFVFASGAEFTDSEKSGAARINELFSTARRNAPAFVFVDEIDAIAGRHARKDPRRSATFEALIAQLDGEKVKTGVDRFSLRQAVIFICATNRPDELDLEFVRPGRIDRRVYIGLPDAKQRVQIFGVHSAGKELAEDVDFEKVVFRTVGYSGADIRNLVNEAGIMSVRKGHSKIYHQDIIDVLDKQLLEGMGVLLTEEEQQKCEQSVSFEKKRLLAVHEAGHILLAHLFPRFDWHAFSQLLPGGKETAVSVFYPREDTVDQGYTTFGYLQMQMVVAHGGRCAERIVFGDDITDGGRDDLEKITKIAREMVISPRNPRLGLTALTKRIGLVDRPDNPDGEVIRYKYIDEAEELAMKGLKDNRPILDMIARELLEHSRITGLEVQERMRELSPIMFEDFVKPFQINLDEDGPLPHNDRLRFQPLDIYPAPLHRC
ncbi:UNVERIFIED_CONTAM: ATP-dependent zinc metalloprotease FTSH 12, chloroplastic [Sesamum calycinum]|uniref:Nuclear cap-binding protein subunit 1 n=2 Tax=Magnoliopsida TaxID=3398 RepID=A0AAW2Q5H9_9LAMI